MKRKLSIILLALTGITSIQAKDIYVAPDGKRSGSGSKSSPIDLGTALSQYSPAGPGDTIYLRGGTYVGKFYSRIQGSSSSPITVRSAPGEWARIDSGSSPEDRDNILQIVAPNVTFRDFEILSSNTKRSTSISGSSPGDIRRGSGVSVLAPNIKLINLVVHDTSQGISLWSEGPNTEVYGCIIYHNGWQGPDRAHGHGIYAQNESGTKWIRDNIIFNQFGKGIQIYGSSSATLRNFTVEGNIIFNNGVISRDGEPSSNISIYGGNGPRGIVVRNNLLYGTDQAGNLEIGGPGAQDLVFTGNYVPQLTRISFWEELNISDNTFIRNSSMLELYRTSNVSDYEWNNNTFFSLELRYQPFALFIGTTIERLISGESMSYNEWVDETGFDDNSSYVRSAPTPKVFVRPNAYVNGRGHVVVYNWNKSSSMSVSLGSILSKGQRYEIRNAQNYFSSPVASGTYEGGSVSIPMSSLSVASPVGASRPPSTAPTFGVFVVQATSSPDSSPSPEPDPEPSTGSGSDSSSSSAPVISRIDDLIIDEDNWSASIPFTVSDPDTSSSRISLIGSSSNPSVIPVQYIQFGGSGSSRTVRVINSPDVTGEAVVTIAATDGTHVGKRSFRVTVRPSGRDSSSGSDSGSSKDSSGESSDDSNAYPKISAISRQTTYGGKTKSIEFTISDAETPASELKLYVRSFDESLLPPSKMSFSGSGTDRALSVTPASGAYGEGKLCIIVTDGKKSTERYFYFTSAK